LTRLANHSTIPANVISIVLHEEAGLEEQRVPEVGQEAPDFTMPATTGGPITLAQYRGERAVVLAFYVLDWTGG
jgi:peroxiredoxin